MTLDVTTLDPPPAIVRPSQPDDVLDVRDPRVIEAARVPGRIHTAVGRVGLRHDERHAAAHPLARAVLLVHDDPMLLIGLGDLLRGAGITVVPVATLTDARLHLGARRGPPPGVLVLDYVLGHTTAMELLRELPREFRAVVISAHPDTSRIEREAQRYSASARSTPMLNNPGECAAFLAHVIAMLDDATPEHP